MVVCIEINKNSAALMNLHKLTIVHTAFTLFTSGEVYDDEAAVPTGGQNLQRPKRTIRNTFVCTAESFNF